MIRSNVQRIVHLIVIQKRPVQVPNNHQVIIKVVEMKNLHLHLHQNLNLNLNLILNLNLKLLNLPLQVKLKTRKQMKRKKENPLKLKKKVNPKNKNLNNPPPPPPLLHHHHHKKKLKNQNVMKNLRIQALNLVHLNHKRNNKIKKVIQALPPAAAVIRKIKVLLNLIAQKTNRNLMIKKKNKKNLLLIKMIILNLRKKKY
jgi:hypothetical protein